MTAYEFCGRMDDNIGAILDGPDPERGSKCIVDHYGDPVTRGDLGNSFDVWNIAVGISERF